MIKEYTEQTDAIEEDELELVTLLTSVECELLNSGYKSKFMEYFFCPCDPDQKEPICEKCFLKCHESHTRGLAPKDASCGKRLAICHCGITCHVVTEAGVPKDSTYKTECMFMEWSATSKLNIYYKKHELDINTYCMFCYHFCHENYSAFIKCNFIGDEVPKCTCTHKNHEDMRSIFNKILELKNLSEFNFNYITPVHLFNLILLSNESYQNLYHSFEMYVKTLQREIEKESFLFDSNIGYSVVMKSLENFTTLANACKGLFYFCDRLDGLLCHRAASGFLFILLEKKFDYKTGKNIWILKRLLLDLYYKVIFKRDFESLPKLTIRDIENLNPFQRMLCSKLIDNSQDLSSYINNLRKAYLDSIINIMEKIKNIKEKNDVTFDILRRLYSICKTFARYNKISSDQRLKIFSLNDEIMFSAFDPKRVTDGSYALAQLKMLVPMAKMILYLVYHFNDEILEVSIRGKQDVSKVAFFHSNNDVGKMICKNCTNILNCVRILKSENYTTVVTKTSMTIQPINSTALQMNDMIFLTQLKKDIEKASRKVIFYANDITALTINYPDFYLIGLRRLLSNSKEIYVSYINHTLSENEENALKLFNELTTNMEQTYKEFFTFRCGESAVKNIAMKSIRSFFDMLGIDEYKLPSKDLPSNLVIENNEHSNFLIQDSINRKNLYVKNKNVNFDTTRIPNLKMKDIINVNPNVENESINHIRKLKYKILVNKTTFFFSLIKSLRILLTINQYRWKEFPHRIIIDDDYLEEMFKFLYYFVEDNQENCMLLLTQKIVDTFLDLNKSQIHRFVDLIDYILHIFLEANFVFSSNKVILSVINRLIGKVSDDPERFVVLQKILKIIKIFTELQVVNQEHTYNKLRKIMKNFFKMNPILIEFKSFLKNQSNFFDVQQGGTIMSVLSSNNVNAFREEDKTKEEIPKPRPSSNIAVISKRSADVKQQQNTLNGYNITMLFNIFTKFLNIITFLFDGDATLNETEFLSQILSHMEIPKIITKKDLSLSLRIEMLKFFRIVYIDVIIDPTKKGQYISLFVNPISISEERGLYEEGTNYKFFHDLMNINHSGMKISLESAVLKFELKNFSQIIEGSKNENSKKILDYFENGILLPLYVFLTKFMSIIYNLKGSEYIKLYEIVIYFLKLKSFLILNSTKMERISPFTFQNIFKTFALNKKNKYSLIEKGISEEHLKSVNDDIEEMCKPQFEILNYKTIYSYFEKHVVGFISIPKSKSLKDLFLKKEVNYSEDEVKKREKEWRSFGYFKSNFERRIWEICVKYENDKARFNESALVQNLGEQNMQYDANYRSIILRSMFYLINDTKFSMKYTRQNLWHIFKLLQYDTGETQSEIYSIMSQEKEKEKEKGIRGSKTVDLEKIVGLFFDNLLSLIFASCNPSTTVMNEDYFIAITVIKIMKYMCEDHNTKFQTIFFQELKFEYTNHYGITGELSLFELMLGILGKISILAKWDKVEFDMNDNSVTYFYDIFFVIVEFCIEMVQGTTPENLEQLLIIPKEEEVSHFYRFLSSVKNLVTNNKNDSLCVYKVRKDLIDFVVAFLEEKSTHKKLITQISSIYNPLTIFESIVNTLKKLYIKTTCKQENLSKFVKCFTEEIFDHKKCSFFVAKYFSDTEFCETPEFELANRMYQYVKLLATSYENEDAISIISSINVYQEEKLIDIYTQKNKNLSRSGNNSNSNSNTSSNSSSNTNIDDNSTDVVLDENYFQNYFAVKFFEQITRSIYVQKDGTDVMVLMTLNPLIPYLSENTKREFYNNVQRDTRYTKLFSLMEYSSYFFLEIKYNKQKLENNWFLQKLNRINYNFVETLMYLITLIINLIMICKLHAQDLETELDDVYPIIRGLGFVQIALNALFLIIWFISKFSLYFLIETKKYIQQKKQEDDQLSVLEYWSILFFHTILLKNETTGLIWNIIFSSFGVSSPKNTFLFAIQLLIIINLSVTLKNIIKAVTMRYQQLLATATFIVIMLYVFSCIAFFFLSQDFVFTIESNQENQCGSLLYCFLTHLDYGLRTDGGIGEHLKKISYSNSEGYFVGRFFYELIFFIIIIIILLSIVSGIIIDTFAELREESTEIDNDMLNKCYICGAKRDELEKECQNYDYHVTQIHNLWTYVDYMIGLKFVDKQETNAVNSYVIEKIEGKKISWFPAFKKKEDGEGEEEETHH